jgi:ribosomal protein S18 acetylase RimI-like enzyme
MGNCMALEWEYSSENVDWEELYRLYRSARLGDESASNLRAGFSKSTFKCFAYDSGTLIAAGRALVDREDGSYLCGIAVHPDYQGLGIGRELVTRLITLSKGRSKIYLHASPGKEPFYRKLGFKRTGATMAIFQRQVRSIENGLLAERP